MSIEELKYQCNPWNRKHPTIHLSWQAPICHVSSRDIEYVIYANDQEVQVVSGPATSVVLSTLTPLKNYKFRVTARDRRTKEEGLYYQSFETFLGEVYNYTDVRYNHICTASVLGEHPLLGKCHVPHFKGSMYITYYTKVHIMQQ